MRLVHYYAVNKKTGEKLNAGCYRRDAEEIIANKSDKENWTICLHWLNV